MADGGGLGAVGREDDGAGMDLVDRGAGRGERGALGWRGGSGHLVLVREFGAGGGAGGGFAGRGDGRLGGGDGGGEREGEERGEDGAASAADTWSHAVSCGV